MKGPTRQHYLPQMYLRGFADENELVWVFDRQRNSYKHQGIADTAVKRDFYTVRDKEGNKSYVVETTLANMVEGPTKRIIEKLDRRNLKWEGEERQTLALFIALLGTRNITFDK